MTFDELLFQVLELLRREGRLSYRALKRRFDLDDDYLEDLKAEIIQAKKLALDEAGAVLVWTGHAATASAQASAQESAPLSYTPLYLAEKILTSRAALEGERKQVTVLFADLKGSTELIQGLDPEEARALLDPALHLMMDAGHRYEGTVNQVLGDGIMALFGAPVAHEDHAARACYTALAMQASMQHYAAEVRRAHGLEIQARVGLNSGAVVVRSIGNDLHMDYSAVGQTTHLAARLEQLATPGSIRLSAATCRLVEGLIQVHALGPFPVKGVPEPVDIFELRGASPTRRRLQASVARGLTRFVLLKGDFDEAIPRLEGSLVMARANQTPPSPAALAFLTHAYALAGRVAEALPLFAQSLERAAAIKFLPCNSLWIGWWGDAELQVGHLDDARQHATRALEIARVQKEQGYEAYALRLLGSIAAQPHAMAVDQAESCYRKALARAEKLGMRPLQAHCHLGLGRLYAQIDRHEQARAALSTAVTLYRAMEMTCWLPQAEAALVQVGGG